MPDRRRRRGNDAADLRGRPGSRTRHVFFHALIGRATNDALSRIVALWLSQLRGGNAVATPDDYGFVLSVRPEVTLAEADLGTLLAPARLEEDLDESLNRTELIKYHFRNAAQTGLMVYRNYFGPPHPSGWCNFPAR